ncbi:MAG: hypothetical protein VX223_13310 [Myxococcota bacterium]|nr:hypothetical protein [Myxococcota bacterium]
MGILTPVTWTIRYMLSGVDALGLPSVMLALSLMIGAGLTTTAQAIPPGQHDYDKLGQFERATVDPVLKRLGREVESAPNGKHIRQLVVENLDVFTSETDQWLAWANHVHKVTAKDVIAREVLLQPGDRWSKDRVDESIRRIRDPFLSNVVVILPLTTDHPERIDLLVVTKDVWSLRLNTDFEAQGNSLLSMNVSLAENNFLGWRKKLSYGFSMTQGQMGTGPQYVDPNIAGSRMTMTARAQALFSRADGAFEGSTSDVTLAYPLWQLASRWGGSVRFRHYDGPVRVFEGNVLRTYDSPDTPALESVPWEYEYTLYQGTAQLFYQAGTWLKQQVRFGIDVFSTTARMRDGFSGETTVQSAFERDVLPRQETSSAVFLSWRMFTPTWATYRHLATFDLREDYRVGPEFSWRVSQALTGLGSDVDYTSIRALFTYAVDPGLSSYFKLRVEWSGRLQGDELIDQQASSTLYFASPMLADALRLIARAEVSARFNDRSNRFLTGGGDSVLRGFDVAVFQGQRRFIANIELRTAPLPIWFLRMGGVLFWDGGHVSETFSQYRLHQNVGLGLRLLIPQVNPYVIRVDWAFPIADGFSAWPGRVSFGFQQAF